MERRNGIRKFGEREIEALRVIECLKKSGLEIKDIKQFMAWCSEGVSTYQNRYELFVAQKERVEAEIIHMNKVLDMLKYKCWYYETAMTDGGEQNLINLPCDEMPEEIRAAYLNAHKE